MLSPRLGGGPRKAQLFIQIFADAKSVNSERAKRHEQFSESPVEAFEAIHGRAGPMWTRPERHKQNKKKIPKTEKSFSPPAPEWAQLNPGEMAEITKRLAARDFNYSFVCSGLRCAGRRKTFPRASHKRRRNNNNFRCNAVDPSKFFFILEEIVINLDESSRSTRPNSMFFPE